MQGTIEGLPSIMTAQELAKYLKMSPKWGYQTIQRMAREGKIKGIQIGDRWRFTKHQVEAYLSGRK